MTLPQSQVFGPQILRCGFPKEPFAESSSIQLPPSKSWAIRLIFLQALVARQQGDYSMRQHQADLQAALAKSGASWPADIQDAAKLVLDCYRKVQDGTHHDLHQNWEAGEAGTVMRFGLAFLLASGACGILQGKGRAHDRLVGPLVEALRGMGAKLSYAKQEGFPPVRLEEPFPWAKTPDSLHHHQNLFSRFGVPHETVTEGLPTTNQVQDTWEEWTVDGGNSSQFVSALTLVAPFAGKPVRILWPKGRTVSLPYLNLSVESLHRIGVDAGISSEMVWVHPWATPCEASPDFLPEQDWSAAAFWMLRFAVLPWAGEVHFPQLNFPSTQGDSILWEWMTWLAPAVTLNHHGELTMKFDKTTGLPSLFQDSKQPPPKGWTRGPQGLVCEAGSVPDLVPALASWAVLAGVSLDLVGIAHLQHKESNRLRALEHNLKLLGVEVRLLHDHEDCPGQDMGLEAVGISIRPAMPWVDWVGQGRLKGQVPLSARGDHRIAMAMSMLALPEFPVILDQTEVVGKSYPGFWEQWQQLGYRLHDLN